MSQPKKSRHKRPRINDIDVQPAQDAKEQHDNLQVDDVNEPLITNSEKQTRAKDDRGMYS